MAILKRIVFTVTNDLTYDRRMLRICTTLANNHFQVVLVGRKLTNSLPLKTENFQQIRLKCVFNKGKLFYLEYNIRLFFFLLFSKADIFSSVDLDTIIPVYYASLLKGTKRVFDAHEYFEEVPEVTHRKTIKKIWKNIARFYIPKFHQHYTVGEALANIFQKQYATDFSVIKNVPNLIEQPNNNEGKYLLYQGALNEGRGLEQLIEAMRHINMPLKIAGEGDLSFQLRKLVTEKNLQHKIEFLGFVAPDKLNALTEQAYIGLNLLENKGESYFYSLANKYFDYIQAEIPIITMAFPEYQNINNQFEVALLIEDLNITSILNAIEKLLLDKSLYLKLKLQCREAKLLFNWQQEQLKLIAIYQSIATP